MIKLIIFDLDGVLVDAKEIHYAALNCSLENVDIKYVIGRQEHLLYYDGLPTKRKLQMLTSQKQLPVELYDQIWFDKQQITLKMLDGFTEDHRIINVLSQLKNNGYTIMCATNSIRDSAIKQLTKKGFLPFFTYVCTNEDVKKSKPATEMYLRCMLKAEVDPIETLILEDSYIGQLAVFNSGANLCPIADSNALTLEYIEQCINIYNNPPKKMKYKNKKLKILIPMSGAGSRFKQAGFELPKPLISVNGKPMIQTVVENLNIEAQYIFIVQQEHIDKYNLHTILNLIAPGCVIVPIDQITNGAACSTLLAKEFINNDDPLLLANSDQYIKWNSHEFMYAVASDNVDGAILSFKATDPKWSFLTHDNNFVTAVAEKTVISDNATVGIYYWKRGSDYVKYAEQMISKNIRTNNEFYVCPVFNEAIGADKKIKNFEIPEMFGLGTPEDLYTFLQTHKE